jgi:flagellar hook assembly protein FlgD
VTLKIYDILGKEVSTIVNEELEAGYYSYRWDGSKLASGIYFYRITAGGYTEVKKMLMIK